MKHWIICHTDPDGFASAAIVYLYLIRLNGDIEKTVYKTDIEHLTKLGIINSNNIVVHPFNYGDDLPDINYNEDYVYLVDISVIESPRNMLDLYKKLGERFIWIDHHKTSVEAEEEIEELSNINGIRSVGYDGDDGDDGDDDLLAGCELTWMWFLDTPIPPLIRLIGDWDTWRHINISGSKAPEVLNYLKSVDVCPNTHEAISFWDKLLFSMMCLPISFNNIFDHQQMVDLIISEGETILRYVKQENKTDAENRSFERELNGIPAIVMNSGKGSDIFDGIYDEEKHHIKISFSYESGERWSISIYTDRDDIDVSEICKKFGGGGHKKASGFQMDTKDLLELLQI